MSQSQGSERSQDTPSEDFERWVSAGLSAASFAGLIQLSTLTPPSAFGSRQWISALSFSIGLVIALFGLFVALAAKGKLVREELPPQWARHLSELTTYCMSFSTLAVAIGAAGVSSHLLDPAGKWHGWPLWIYAGGMASLLGTLLTLTWVEKRQKRRRQLGT